MSCNLIIGKHIGKSSRGWTPQIPTGLTVTVVSDMQINLSWTNVDIYGDGVKIYISTNNVDYALKDTLGLVSSYSATGLLINTRYYFKVAAYKGSKISAYSNIADTYTSLIKNGFNWDKSGTIPDYWDNTSGEACTYSIVTGNGFVGNAVRILENNGDDYAFIQPNYASPDVPLLQIGRVYSYSFKCRSSHNMRLYNGETTLRLITGNTLDAVLISGIFVAVSEYLSFTIDYLANGCWFEIDEVVVIDLTKVESYESFQSVQTETLSQVTISYKIDAGAKVTLNWGEDAVVTLTGDGADHDVTSDYGLTNHTYNIVLSGQIDKIRTLYIVNSTFKTTMDGFRNFTGLTTLGLIGCQITGNTLLLSQSLVTLVLYYMTGVKVYFDDLADTITYLDIDTCDPTSTGKIANLPSTLHYLRITNNNSFGGSLHDFPLTLVHIDIATMRGNFYDTFEHLPSGLTECVFNIVCQLDYSSNITGNLNNLPSGVTKCNFTAVGLTVACNVSLLPSTITWLLLEHFGTNMISGDGSNLNANMTGFGINYCPSNLFTLTVAQLPTAALNWVQLSGCGTITGNIESLSTHLDDALNPGINPNDVGNCPLMFTGIGTGLIYNGGNLPVWKDVTMSIDCGWSSTMIDAFINNFASRTEASLLERIIRIVGSRTSASDAAVTTLAGLNKVITMV